MNRAVIGLPMTSDADRPAEVVLDDCGGVDPLWGFGQAPVRVLNGAMPLIDDRYELLEVIASGGMATVWRARDTRLDRLVAVKRPLPSALGDDPTARRIGREARAAAAINHSNVVTVYDYGSDEEGPYLVMELAEGPNLTGSLHQLDAAEVVEVGTGVAEGLAAIHAAGIIHRDVKPANVILSDRGPLLTDFGIALDPSSTDEVTAEGMIVATPSYAAPEVMAGQPPTQASDVFSLGVVVREMLEAVGTKPGPALEDVLKAAIATAPEDRPDALSLAAAIRGETPTLPIAPSGAAIPVAGDDSDTTLVLESPPNVASAAAEKPDRPGRVLPVALMLLAGVALLLAFALGIGGRDDPGLAAGVTSSTTGVSTTTAATSTTQGPTTTVTTATTPVPAPTDLVAESRDRLEAILLRPPRSDLNQRDVEKVMEDVDDAISEASAGDTKKAEDKLEKVASELDKKLGKGSNRDDALAELEQLAESLGLQVDIR
jgi:serine/threonine protein kinase